MAAARSRRTTRSTQQPQPRSSSVPPLLTFFGAIVGIAAQALGYPGFAAFLVFFATAAYSSQYPNLTGIKDRNTGMPTPAGPGEERSLRRHRFWSDLRMPLTVPFSALVPGLPVYGAWFFGLVAAAAAWCLPQEYLLTRHLNAAATLIAITAWAETRRKTKAPTEPSPGMRISPFGLVEAAEAQGWMASTFALLVVGAGTAIGAFTLGNLPAPPIPGGLADDLAAKVPGPAALADGVRAMLSFLTGHTWQAIGGLGGAGLAALPFWNAYSLVAWRRRVAARAEWKPRWDGVTKATEDQPQLIDREIIGAAIVDTFQAPAAHGAMKYWAMGPQLLPSIGAGKRVAILSTPDIVDGQPQPGTMHPLRFQVVVYGANDTPNIADPALPRDELELFLNAAASWTCDSLGAGRLIATDITPIGLVDDDAIARSRKRPSPIALIKSFAASVKATAQRVAETTGNILGPLLRLANLLGGKPVVFVARHLFKVLAFLGREVWALALGVRDRIRLVYVAWRDARATPDRQADDEARLLEDIFPAEDQYYEDYVADREAMRHAAAAEWAAEGDEAEAFLAAHAGANFEALDEMAAPAAGHPAEDQRAERRAERGGRFGPGPDRAPHHGEVEVPAELIEEPEEEPVRYGSTQGYRVQWGGPASGDLLTLRLQMREQLAASLGCEVLIEHDENSPHQGCYIGALLDGDTEIDESQGISAQGLFEIFNADVWLARWVDILKTNVNPPIIQAAVYAEAELANGVVVHRQPFLGRRGQDIRSTYFGLENELKSALDAVPFTAVTGWQPGNTTRAGDLHGLGFCVIWSERPVPARPDDLAAMPRSEAPQWVLSGLLNDAFKAVKMVKPEIVAVEALSAPRSAGHLWKLDVRLFGGVTLAMIRGQHDNLRRAFGADYLRVTDLPNVGCTIVVGANPARCRLVSQRLKKYLAELDWEHAWIESKVSGTGGLTPTLLEVSTLPRNAAVQDLYFQLPTGLEVAHIREAVGKLKVATHNAFIDVRESPDGIATKVRILTCETNPMPPRVDFDFAAVDTMGEIPFATGVEGEPLVFDPSESPHCLVAGTTGSGKSVGAQNLLYGFLAHGAEVYVIDPIKGGADFQFAKPFSKAFAADPFQAAGVMKAVYAEVVRRKNLNAQYGAGNYRELPPELGLRPIVVMIDEFTSLMGQSQVPPVSDDPQLERDREMIIADNRARVEVGVIAGKLAREARSAGVTLLLGTQKLTAKMLDTIPGGSDLKSLSLDTRLPVPVSEKFPEGWATVAALEEGDLLYAPDGTTTPIIGFTEVPQGHDVYEVTFDDGQVVRAGADHGWLVSDYKSRLAYSRKLYGYGDEGRLRSERVAEYDYIRAVAAAVPDDIYASAEEIATLLGFRTGTGLTKLATDAGLRRFDRDPLTGEPVAQAANRRRGPAPVFWHVDTAVRILSNREGIENLAPLAGSWATARTLIETMLGHPVAPVTAGNLGTALKNAGCPKKSGEHTPTLYRAADLTALVVEHLKRALGVDPFTGEVWSRERVVTTSEMATKVKAREGENNWAISNPEPIGGPDVDLPVDPYVLGAWLGDGSKSSGIITSSRADSCLDPDSGISDQEHMLAEVRSAGYEAHAYSWSNKIVSVLGLQSHLRAAGVLNNKHIPAIYLRASFRQRLALLQGLMDTDGSTMASGTCTFPQVNETLSRQARELIESLGIKVGYTSWDAAYLPEGATEKKLTGTVHNLSFRSNLPVFRLPRKLAKQGRHGSSGKATRRYIASIELVESIPTRCIGVEHPSHLFLVGGFVPTHNTNLARILLGKASHGDRASALRAFDTAPMLEGDIPKGRGLWEPLTSSAMVIQTWFAPQGLDEPKPGTLYYELAQRIPALPEDQVLDVTQFTPPEPDVDGAIIETGASGAGAARGTINPPPHRPAVTGAAPDVVDLGEVEFSLDELEEELEFSLDELESELADVAADTEPDSSASDDAPIVVDMRAETPPTDAPAGPPVGPSAETYAPMPEPVWDADSWDDAEPTSPGPTAAPEIVAPVVPSVEEFDWDAAEAEAAAEAAAAQTAVDELVWPEDPAPPTPVITEPALVQPEPSAEPVAPAPIAAPAVETPPAQPSYSLPEGYVDADPAAYGEVPTPSAEPTAPVPTALPTVEPGAEPELAEAVIDIAEVVQWLDIEPTPFLPERHESLYGWSEIDAVINFVRDYRDVRTIMWPVDEEGPDGLKLSDPSPFDYSYAELLDALLAAENVSLNRQHESLIEDPAVDELAAFEAFAPEGFEPVAPAEEVMLDLYDDVSPLPVMPVDPPVVDAAPVAAAQTWGKAPTPVPAEVPVEPDPAQGFTPAAALPAPVVVEPEQPRRGPAARPGLVPQPVTPPRREPPRPAPRPQPGVEPHVAPPAPPTLPQPGVAQPQQYAQQMPEGFAPAAQQAAPAAGAPTVPQVQQSPVQPVGGQQVKAPAAHTVFTVTPPPKKGRSKPAPAPARDPFDNVPQPDPTIVVKRDDF